MELIGVPNPKQEQFFMAQARHVGYGGSRGGGKSLPISSSVLTPTGFKKMADMKVGSLVTNPDGTVARVIGVYPQGVQDVYRVRFVDGAEARATLDHLWLARKTCTKKPASSVIDLSDDPWFGTKGPYGRFANYPGKIRTTEEIIQILQKKNNSHVLVPLTDPVPLRRRAELPIDPYVLGLMLGNGYLSSQNKLTYTGHVDDEEIFDVFREHGFTFSVTQKGKGLTYSLNGEGAAELRTKLRKLRLLGKKAQTKFIPGIYRYTSVKNRLALLQGLMDTDGYIDERGHCEYCSTSRMLAKGVQWIVRSLGGKATLTSKICRYRNADGEVAERSTAYLLYIQMPRNSEMFRLKRKKKRSKDEFNGGVSELQRRIVEIIPDGQEECQCITVDHPNGLYITDDFIVTHNSWAMRRKCVLLALNYSGLKILLLRRTMPELRENHILPLMGELQNIAKYNGEERAFTFLNGSRIKLGYCETEGDVYQFQGQEYDIVAYEEATQFTEWQRDFILTCNRSTRPDFRARAYYTANPGGVGHAWFKRLFIDRQYRGSESPDDYVFIPAKVYDNPILMDNNPEYVKLLENLPEDLRKAHLEGNWDVFAGQAFRDFDRDVHVVNPIKVPEQWPRFRALDWGYSKPYCCLWGAVDHNGTIYIYRELYGCKENLYDTGTQETAKQVAEKIKRMEGSAPVFSAVADPSIWSKTGLGPSIAEEFASVGVYWRKADNERINGWMQLNTRLRDQTVKIFNTCTHLIRTLPAMVYDRNRCEDIDTDQEDHAVDALRYMLMSRPWRPEKQVAEKNRDRYDKSRLKPKSWMAL